MRDGPGERSLASQSISPVTSSNSIRNTLIVVPCYNESRRLDAAQVEAFVLQHPDVRFLFVDDGSTDGTFEILEVLASRHPDAIALKKLAVNLGKAEAVRQGVLAGLCEDPEFLGYWDADLATPLEAIADFRATLVANPRLIGVLGSRIRRLGANVERRALRHYSGRIFASLASIVLGLGVYDTQCGAKLFRTDSAFASAFREPFSSRWIFDVEILARLKRELGARELAERLFEFPLSRWEDVGGSKVTWRQGLLAFVELWKIYRGSL